MGNYFVKNLQLVYPLGHIHTWSKCDYDYVDMKKNLVTYL